MIRVLILSDTLQRLSTIHFFFSNFLCLFCLQFLKFMNHKKSRLTDLFRKMDKNNDGLIPREDFIDGIMKTSKEIDLFLITRLPSCLYAYFYLY